MKITSSYNARVIVKHVSQNAAPAGFASVEEEAKDVGEIVHLPSEVYINEPDHDFADGIASDHLKVGTKIAFIPHGTYELQDDVHGKVLSVPIEQIIAIVE